MADDLVLSKSVDRNSVVAAIEALQHRGADVNPYSLADEMKVSVNLLIESGEWMEMLSHARKELNGPVAAEYDRLRARVKELEAAPSSRGTNHSDLQDECRLLQARVDEEAARSRRLEEETRLLRNKNDALQNEISSLKSPHGSTTVEISRPGDGLNELNGLFAANNDELARLRKENEELQAFKKNALSEEEQQALSQHLASMTAKQGELNMLIDHLQRENARLASGTESVLTAEELAVLREHIENLTAQNTTLNEQIQQLSNERAELAARQLELTEQYSDLVEQNKKLAAGGGTSDETQARLAQLETEKGKLKETVAALESANQLLATSIQESYQQGYHAAKLEFAREHFAQPAPTQDAEPEEEYQVPDYMNAGLFDESEDELNGSEVYADVQPQHYDGSLQDHAAQYQTDGVNQEETVDKLEMLEQHAREAAAAAMQQQQQHHEQQQSYGAMPGFNDAPYTPPQGTFGDPSLVSPGGFGSDGYSPYAKVDVESYGFADVPSDEEKTTKSYSADELRDLVQHRLHQDEPGAPEGQKTVQGLKKFVGGSRNTQEVPLPSMPRNVPPDIRKACLLLGLKPEELTRQNVFNAWKREMAKPGVHPDTGGDTEMAAYLNTAKDKLVRFLEETAPKLGKKFGSKENPTKEHNRPPKK